MPTFTEIDNFVLWREKQAKKKRLKTETGWNNFVVVEDVKVDKKYFSFLGFERTPPKFVASAEGSRIGPNDKRKREDQAKVTG